MAGLRKKTNIIDFKLLKIRKILKHNDSKCFEENQPEIAYGVIIYTQTLGGENAMINRFICSGLFPVENLEL